MPTLNWIGKEKVVNHHRDVPFRVLEHQYGFSADKGETKEPTGSGNMIIHGDNLEALKALLPEYEGKVKCIYIDPPYNTGNEGWVYNDNVNHPKIKKWLGEVVGKEGDDLTRHDKWLCMMYPRIKLLHRLLAKDGAIFISIDDNEQAHLKLLCDEIFGLQNSIGPIIQNKQNSKNDTINVQKNHEYILIYRKSKITTLTGKALPTLINEKASSKKVFKEGDNYYFLNDYITTRGEGGILNARPNLGHTIYFNPESQDIVAIRDYDLELAKVSNDEDEVYGIDQDLIDQGYLPIRPPRVRGKLGCWTWSLEKVNNQKKELIITGIKGKYGVKKRTFVSKSDVIEIDGDFFLNDEEISNSRSIIDFSTNDGSKILSEIMGENGVFDNPKNVPMLEYLIGLIPDSDAVVLDSFAGSGSTAQAVLNLNERDMGNRKFILIEMEDYAERITSERIKRVIKGYDYKGKVKETIASYNINLTTLKKSSDIIDEYNSVKDANIYQSVKIETGSDGKTIELIGLKEIKGKIDGIDGSFDFYKLGKPLFIGDNKEHLNEEVGIDKIRQYIWYSETRTAFEEPTDMSESEHFLGLRDQTAYYFYYQPDEITTLDHDFLATIKTKAEQYVIYADNCLLSKEFMVKHNIIFKKIPRDITRF